MKRKLFAAPALFLLIFAAAAPAKPKKKSDEPVLPLTWGTSIATFDNQIPENIPYQEKYKGGSAPYVDYVFVATKVGTLFRIPEYFTETAKTGITYPYMTKLGVLEQFNYKSNDWYKVRDAQGNDGYIIAPETRKRYFRFEMALDKIKNLEAFIRRESEAGHEIARTNSYSPNPANVNAKTQKDKYGTSWEQNTVGKHGTETIYIPDSSILAILSQKDGKATVRVSSIPEDLVIDAKTLSHTPKISKDFKKAVAVDIMNQNAMLFEKMNGQWTLISYVYARTGIESNLGYETPKGNFIVPVIKYIMGYTDASGKQEGNARYAMRFSGGGYMHGTPLAFDEEHNREFVMRKRNGYLGLYTGTRKCIRTTEEHARFMFEWMCVTPNKNNNEQTPTENIMFVIF